MVDINNSDESDDSTKIKLDINDIDKKIEYNYINSTSDSYKPSPYKEILRYICIDGLNSCFLTKLNELNIKYDVNDLFKNNSCKLIELINRWCWHQYNNKTCQDYVIPYVKDGNYDYERFVDDLNYILNIHGTDNAVKLDDKLIIELKKIISIYLEIQYLDYAKRSNIEINVNRESFDKKFKLTCIYKSKTYQVTIHSKVYWRLKDKLLRFGGSEFKILKDCENNIDNYLDQYIFCLIFRYSYMDSGNQQLAIHPLIKDIYRNDGVNFELFGSAINTLSINYCSLFYDIEKYFGSSGDFFDIKIESGIYWCNPPYDDTIMLNAANKLIQILESNKNVVFLVTIPIWDILTQQKIRDDNIDQIIRNYNSNTESKDHEDFQIYAKLKPYIKDELMIPKHKVPYFNYRKYSNINAVNTYMLIIYNNINYDSVKNLHKNFDRIIDLDQKKCF